MRYIGPAGVVFTTAELSYLHRALETKTDAQAFELRAQMGNCINLRSLERHLANGGSVTEWIPPLPNPYA